MNEEITKAVRALEKAKQTLDDESLSLNRNLDHIEAHINAALTALREQPAHVGVKSGIVETLKARLASASINDRRYERPMTWEEADELLSALQPSPARDYGKMMQPPADATHCGGYPVNSAREEAEELVNELRGFAAASAATEAGDGAFMVIERTGHDSEGLAMNLRAVLRDAAAFIARHHLGEKP
jgi:hypothetical protein